LAQGIDINNTPRNQTYSTSKRAVQFPRGANCVGGVPISAADATNLATDLEGFRGRCTQSSPGNGCIVVATHGTAAAVSCGYTNQWLGACNEMSSYMNDISNACKGTDGFVGAGWRNSAGNQHLQAYLSHA